MSTLGICRSCKATIAWMKTYAGKNIPVDLIDPTKPHTGVTEEAVNRHNDLILGSLIYDSGLMTAHFATCVNANFHRKKR